MPAGKTCAGRRVTVSEVCARRESLGRDSQQIQRVIKTLVRFHDRWPGAGTNQCANKQIVAMMDAGKLATAGPCVGRGERPGGRASLRSNHTLATKRLPVCTCEYLAPSFARYG